MTMTQSNYELIAEAINGGIAGNTIEEGGDIWAIVQSITRALESDNPKFNRDKFLKACGLEE